MKYKVLIPSEVKDFVPKKINFDLYFSTKNNFVLPDTTCLLRYSKSTFKIGNLEYHSISSIGISLTPKIFIQLRNSDVLGEEENMIYKAVPNFVMDINQMIYNECSGQVISPDLETLKNLQKKPQPS
ncbi:MAG: hypothetical protein GY827_06430 [Cytophagales bacterium]|nr:hypothetical protein [Cytophagales bacterium]